MTHAGMIGRATIEAGSYLPRSRRGHGKKSAVSPIGRPRVRTYDIMRSGGSSNPTQRELRGGAAHDVRDVRGGDETATVDRERLERLTLRAEPLDVGHVRTPHEALGPERIHQLDDRGVELGVWVVQDVAEADVEEQLEP
jgi:hypothetical protein